MCGLVGIFHQSGPVPIDRKLLSEMNDTLIHRGPDGGDIFVDPGIGLGHRRLSIIDLSSGDQPMSNQDSSITVVFNGEIYNFPELRSELQDLGYIFRTHSDTEVIIHGWDAWGPKCLQRLRGMFAIALWERKSEKLYLCRDRLGKKPLYYSLLPDGQVVFGSELKALMKHPETPRKLEPTAIEDFFAYGYIPDPKTIYQDVYKLPPAHILTLSRQESPKLDSYWDIVFSDRISLSEPDACLELIERLETATAIRLISDVPLGAFLSGGVDSSGIVALMAKQSETPVNTFSISFKGTAVDESAYATQMAERYQTAHTSKDLDPDEFSILDKLASIYDEPFGDSSAMPTYRVCKEARRHVKVALSGDGGDELFAGYRRYLWHQREADVRSVISPTLSKLVFGTLGNLYPKLDWAPRFLRAKSTFQELGMEEEAAFFQSVSANNKELRQKMLSGDLKTALDGYDPSDVLKKHMQAANTDSPLLRAQYADLKTWLAGGILTKVDRASMAASLEVRAPLLDHKLAEWALNLSPSLKLKGRTGKFILKRALEPYVSEQILYRPKQGFSMPLAKWFRGPLKDKIQTSILSERMRDSRFFSEPQVQKLLEEHQSGLRDHSTALWQLMMFDSFLKLNTAI